MLSVKQGDIKDHFLSLWYEDLGLSPVLPDLWGTLYSLRQWPGNNTTEKSKNTKNGSNGTAKSSKNHNTSKKENQKNLRLFEEGTLRQSMIKGGKQNKKALQLNEKTSLNQTLQ